MERMTDGGGGYGSADPTMADSGTGLDEPRSPRKTGGPRPRKKAAKARRKPVRRRARAKTRAKTGGSRKRRKTAKKRRP
jgi:hypothetical protein